MAKFRYKSRKELSEFLTGIGESVACIISADTTAEATMAAQRTGPHLSHHMCECVEQEMNDVILDAGQEWTVNELSSHIIRVVISYSFAIGTMGIAAFEQLTLDVLDRYEGGDYSFTVEETKMNRRSEKLRTTHTIDDGAMDIPDLLKVIMETIDKMMGDHADIKIMNEEDMIDMLRKRMKDDENRETDPEEEEE